MIATSFTDPYSGKVVLCLDMIGFSCGATYDPLRATSVLPWRTDCRHCRSSDKDNLSVHVRREIELLCTRQVKSRVEKGSPIYQYTLALDQTRLPHQIAHWRDADVQHVEISLDSKVVASVTKPDRGARVVSGNLKSKILSRAVRFLMSGETTKSEIVLPIAEQLAQVCETKLQQPGRRIRCYEVDWKKISALCKVEMQMGAV